VDRELRGVFPSQNTGDDTKETLSFIATFAINLQITITIGPFLV